MNDATALLDIQTDEILGGGWMLVEEARTLPGEVHGHNVLPALEEAGDHVEYLYQRGLLRIDNLFELEGSSGPAAVCYRCMPCQAEQFWNMKYAAYGRY